MKTEKRQAKIGEIILVTNPETTFGAYKKGDKLTVKGLCDGYGKQGAVNVEETHVRLYHGEYEVIVEEGGSLSKHAEELTELVERIERKAYKRGYSDGEKEGMIAGFDEGFDQGQDGAYEKIRRDAEKDYAKKAEESRKESAQRLRDEVIAAAKSDIEGLKTVSFVKNIYSVPYKTSLTGLVECNAEFVVNREKRTVVALMVGCSTGKVRARGIAKCHPDDCFNSHIGRAIALRRVLGEEVPEDYFNAPNPTEAREGDIARMRDPFREKITLGSRKPELDDDGYGKAFRVRGENTWAGSEQFRIIDDSREVEI